MRARNIKPGFFQNEDLAELCPETRLLFIGLWLLADRQGLLEDRPKKIKMQIFPADSWDVDPMLQELADQNLIVRYIIDSKKFISIPAWDKHQNPHVKERDSTIPAPDSHSASPETTGTDPADSLIPDSLIPSNGRKATAGFDDFWAVYPKKRKKKTALDIWRRKKPDASVLIADVRARLTSDKQWLKGFVPDPTTYLNGERWNDDMGDSTSAAKTTDDYALEFGMTPRPDESDERFQVRVRDVMLVREGQT